MHGRALAEMYGVLARGGAALLRPHTLELATREQSDVTDLVLDLRQRRTYGWMLASGSGRTAWGPSTRTFGHTGAGGSLGFADPDAGIGFGYTTATIVPVVGADPRWERILHALYACLSQSPHRGAPLRG
jgi:CubicO group peptidase (beta-lactamase class C family)